MPEYTPIAELLRPVLEAAQASDLEPGEAFLDELLQAPVPTRLALALFLGGSLSLTPDIKATFGGRRFTLEWPEGTMDA